jgi:flavin-dependent dehydrogenase
MAVGGSAGHFYQLSGQGLRYAIEGGKIAGKVAVEAITDGDVSLQRLSEYERGWKSEFGFDIEVGSLLHAALGVAQDRKMDELIRALKGSPALQSAFINVFFGSKLRASLKKLMGDESTAQVFGRSTVAKVLALK